MNEILACSQNFVFPFLLYFLPWMALDILFFDELFLLPIYGAFAVAYGSAELNDV